MFSNRTRLHFRYEKANANPNYWVEYPYSDDWKTITEEGNTYYGTKATEKEANTWIHVYEKDPTVSLDFKYDAKKTDSNMGFYVRMSPETAYIKIGYDTTLQKWYLIDTEAENDSDINTTYSKEIALKENEWHKLKIKVSGKYISVTVDDKTVLEKIEVTQIGYGRIGAYCKNAALDIDNVHLEFPNGDVPQDGLIEYTMSDAFYDAGVDLQVLENNHIIGLGVYGSYYSKDGGLSFDVIGGSSADKEVSSSFFLHDAIASCIAAEISFVSLISKVIGNGVFS